MVRKRKRSPPKPKSIKSKPLDNQYEDCDDDPEITFRDDGPRQKKARIESDGEDNEPRRSPNGFILPDPLPLGSVLIDNRGCKWKVGKSIGIGGFGEIYDASFIGTNGISGQSFVVKVEPHSNGPLFAEIAFYLKCCRKQNIEQWKEDHNLDHLGVAQFVASGSYFLNKKKFRFLILPKYGTDLQSIIDSSQGGTFSIKTSCTMAIQVVNALEFIHSKGYIHKDIKGSNLLVDRTSTGHVFLVDFGLCSKYTQNDLHKPYQHDQRWAHEGTLEYTSRDSHVGCFSRRGDLEVLLYNLIEWMGGKLPWEDLQDVKPIIIQEKKMQAFRDIDEFLQICFAPDQSPPEVLKQIMVLIDNLSFEEKPDYALFRQLLQEEIKFISKEIVFDEVQLNMEITSPKVRSRIRKKSSKNCGKENEDPLLKAAGILNNNHNLKCRTIIHKRNTKNRLVSEKTYERMRETVFKLRNEESMRNPTPAMIYQMGRMNERQNQGKQFSPQWRNKTPSRLTPEMRAIIDRRKQISNNNKGNNTAAIGNRSRNSKRQLVFHQKTGTNTSYSEPRHVLRPRRKSVPTTGVVSAISESSSTPVSFRSQVQQVVGVGLDLLQGLFPSFRRPAAEP